LITALPPSPPWTIPILWVAKAAGMGNEPIQDRSLAGRSLAWASGHSDHRVRALFTGDHQALESPEPGAPGSSFVAAWATRCLQRASPWPVLFRAASAWRSATLMLLIWGYGVRFLAVSKQGLERLGSGSPKHRTIGHSLGCSWFGVLRRIHLPLFEGAVAWWGSLLSSLIVVKELAVDPLAAPLRTRHPGGAGVPAPATNGWGGMGPACDSWCSLVAPWPGASWKASGQDASKRSACPITNRQLRSRRIGRPRGPRLSPCEWHSPPSAFDLTFVRTSGVKVWTIRFKSQRLGTYLYDWINFTDLKRRVATIFSAPPAHSSACGMETVSILSLSPTWRMRGHAREIQEMLMETVPLTLWMQSGEPLSAALRRWCIFS